MMSARLSRFVRGATAISTELKEGDHIGRRKIWQEIRVCPVCGNEFMPEYSNQVYCCTSHADIGRREKDAARRRVAAEPITRRT